jgi:hypothetical protein
MSNCDFVAGRSLIALVTPKPALHAPALGAASALTRPNQSEAHSRFPIQDGCGLPVATGAVS